MKTLDKKTLYKVSEAPQIMICSQSNDDAAEINLPNDLPQLIEEKVWQWPNGCESFVHIGDTSAVCIVYRLL